MPFTDPYANLYSIVSTYFVNHYYNVIYTVAKSAAATNNAPITDTYIELVRQFINCARKDRDTRHSLIINLSEYYSKTTGLIGGQNDFESKLLEAFIPEKYLNAMTESQKDMNTVAIVTEIAQNMGIKIIKSNIITGIIDFRNESRFVQDLQKYGQITMNFLRGDMHTKYMTESLGTRPRNQQNEKMYQYVEKILNEKKQAEETCNTLRNKLRESIRIIHELTEQRNKAVEIVKSSPAVSPLITAPIVPESSPPVIWSDRLSNLLPDPTAPIPEIPKPTSPVLPPSDPSSNWENEFMFDETE